MRAGWIGLAVLGIVVVLAQSAFSADIWDEQKITSGTSGPKAGAEIWGDKVYWNDLRSGDLDVYVWDEAGGERILLGGPDYLGQWAVHEDKLAVGKYVNSQYDLYIWDPSAGMRLISDAPGNQRKADIYGETVVWEDYRSGSTPRVYIWDPINGERRITSADSYQRQPRIWGNTVVWEDWRNGRADIYMWNPTDGERRLSTAYFAMSSPAIHEDRVVMWSLDDPDNPFDEPGLWEWTAENGLRQLCMMYKSTQPQFFDMWGDLAVWCGQGPSNVVAWDPVHGAGMVNQTAFGYAMGPSVYGNQVAWIGSEDDIYDVYISTLIPEPSTFAGLAGFMGLCLLRRRRRIGR